MTRQQEAGRVGSIRPDYVTSFSFLPLTLLTPNVAVSGGWHRGSELESGFWSLIEKQMFLKQRQDDDQCSQLSFMEIEGLLLRHSVPLSGPLTCTVVHFKPIPHPWYIFMDHVPSPMSVSNQGRSIDPWGLPSCYEIGYRCVTISPRLWCPMFLGKISPAIGTAFTGNITAAIMIYRTDGFHCNTIVSAETIQYLH